MPTRASDSTSHSERNHSCKVVLYETRTPTPWSSRCTLACCACDPGLHSVTGSGGAGGESRAGIMTLAGAAVGRVARGAGDLELDRGRHRAFLGAGDQVRDRQPAFLGAFFLDVLLRPFTAFSYLFSVSVGMCGQVRLFL